MAGSAVLFLKRDPHYRRDAFERGLSAAGYRVATEDERSAVKSLGRGDVAVFWNLYAHDTEPIAKDLLARGCDVLVAENGYFGKDENGHQLYALARNGHNGSGVWHVGDEDRMSVANVGGPAAWKTPEKNAPFLICGQRGIGSLLMASPPGWHHNIARQLEAAGIPFVARPHPGQDVAAKDSLASAISGSRGVIIWSSSAGLKALMLGIPVWYDAPHWVAEAGARKYLGPTSLNFPLMDDDKRADALRATSWAQWTLKEIESGLPFRILLQD